MKKTYKFTKEELLDTPYLGEAYSENENTMLEDLDSVFKKSLEDIADDHKVHVLEDISTLEGTLDKIFKSNVQQRRNLKPGKRYLPLNVLIIGDAGTGKSEIIKNWIENKKVKGKAIREFKMNGSNINSDQVQGVGHAFSHKDVDPETGKEVSKDYADYVTFQTFKKLDPKEDEIYGSIFFIDELNRSMEDARAALLDMITSHEIMDSTSDTNTTKLNKWVMTVAAMNPPNTAHKGAMKLDLAMLTRFYVFYWKGSIKGTREFLLKDTQELLDQAKLNLEAGVGTDGIEYDEEDYKEDKCKYEGQLNLIKKVMTPKLSYTTNEEALKNAQNAQRPVLNSRTLEAAIKDCDGTVEDFLRLLEGHCGIDPKSDAYKAIKAAVTDEGLKADAKVATRVATAYDKLKEFEDSL